MTSSRLAIASLVSMALFVVGLSGFFSWSLLWPFDPLTKLAVRVVNQPVVGEHLIVEVDYCKEREWVPHEVRWSLVNEITVLLPPTTMSMPVGCHIKRLALPLSLHVPAGHYLLQEENIYQPWPWRSFTYVRRSPPFRVLPAGSSPGGE